jgi:hypothetical protein
VLDNDGIVLCFIPGALVYWFLFILLCYCSRQLKIDFHFFSILSACYVTELHGFSRQNSCQDQCISNVQQLWPFSEKETVTG